MSESTALTILSSLDRFLNSSIELTLYGRAALQLGFADPPQDFAMTRDVDAVLWIGQAEQLLAETNFWDAVEATNAALGDQELYISHFFSEEQVVLRPEWKTERVAIEGPWQHLRLFRLGNLDLLLSKLMRDDPIDQADARFIVTAGALTAESIENALAAARVPASPEVKEQLAAASRRLLAGMRRGR
jgi:hypothetical protein